MAKTATHANSNTCYKGPRRSTTPLPAGFVIIAILLLAQPMPSFLNRLRRRVTLGVQGVVTDASGRVLLVKHTYRPGWHFPGGGVERGEAAETALARELREEAYVALTGEPRLFQIYSHFDDFPGDHIALYRVPSWTRTPGHFPTHEIAECCFFDRHALPPDVVPPVHARLSELFDGVPPGKTW